MPPLLQLYVEPCTHGVVLSCRLSETRQPGGGVGGGAGPVVAVMHRPSPVLSSPASKVQACVGGWAESQADNFTAPVPSTVRQLAPGSVERSCDPLRVNTSFGWPCSPAPPHVCFGAVEQASRITSVWQPATLRHWCDAAL